jgi:hypothetical protein
LIIEEEQGAEPIAITTTEPSTRAPAKLDIIARAVENAGRAWANTCIEVLHREGRPVAGGWPGTLTEARLRVSACATELKLRPSITREELSTLSRLANRAARKAWLARTATEPDADDADDLPRSSASAASSKHKKPVRPALRNDG